MDIFTDDLRSIMSDITGDEVHVKTGDLAGLFFPCQFETNFLDRNIHGQKIVAAGPVIIAVAEDLKLLTVDDTLEFKGVEYEISKITVDTIGTVRVELRESILGNVTHGKF